MTWDNWESVAGLWILTTARAPGRVPTLNHGSLGVGWLPGYPPKRQQSLRLSGAGTGTGDALGTDSHISKIIYDRFYVGVLIMGFQFYYEYSLLGGFTLKNFKKSPIF